MINRMAAIKSDSNQQEMIGDGEYPEPDGDFADLRKRLDHIDTILHGIAQGTAQILAFIEEHRPALAHGLSLMDPGAKLRSAMGMRPKDGKR